MAALQGPAVEVPLYLPHGGAGGGGDALATNGGLDLAAASVGEQRQPSGQLEDCSSSGQNARDSRRRPPKKSEPSVAAFDQVPRGLGILILRASSSRLFP